VFDPCERFVARLEDGKGQIATVLAQRLDTPLNLALFGEFSYRVSCAAGGGP
jgi:hypothetical protein